MVQTLDQEKKTAILAAARELFLHYGYKKTSVEDIAREAGIAKGTVYLYFRSKQDILATLGVNYLYDSKARLVEDLKSVVDPREKLRRVLRLRAEEIFRFTSEHPHAIDLLLFLSPEEGERLGAGQFYREYMELIAMVLREGQARGVFRNLPDLNDFVFHICFMTQAFQPPYKLVGGLDDLTRQVNAFADVLIAGLETRT